VVVGAFHHLPAAQMEDLDSDLDADVLIFSDDDDARRRVAEMIDRVSGLRAVIAGSMSLASRLRPSRPCASRSTSDTRRTAP